MLENGDVIAMDKKNEESHVDTEPCINCQKEMENGSEVIEYRGHIFCDQECMIEYFLDYEDWATTILNI